MVLMTEVHPRKRAIKTQIKAIIESRICQKEDDRRIGDQKTGCSAVDCPTKQVSEPHTEIARPLTPSTVIEQLVQQAYSDMVCRRVRGPCSYRVADSDGGQLTCVPGAISGPPLVRPQQRGVERVSNDKEV